MIRLRDGRGASIKERQQMTGPFGPMACQWLRPADLWPLAVRGTGQQARAGPRRPPRSAWRSACRGHAAAVLGDVSGSPAGPSLVAQMARPGTNLCLTVASGTVVRRGQTVTLPPSALAHGRADRPVPGAAAIGDVNAQVCRNDRISAANTNARSRFTFGGCRPAADRRAGTLGLVGRFLDAATARYLAAVVLGGRRLARFGVDRSGVLVWLGHR